jgi:excisionase family DNA binding protein
MAMTTEEVLALTARCTVKQTSKALGISMDSAYAGVRSGDIRSVRVGRLVIVPRVEILRILGLDEAHASPAA